MNKKPLEQLQQEMKDRLRPEQAANPTPRQVEKITKRVVSAARKEKIKGERTARIQKVLDARKKAVKETIQAVARDMPIRVEIVEPPPLDPMPEITMPELVEQLDEVLAQIKELTPEEIYDKITSLTDILHIKMQLHVALSLDKLNSQDGQVRKEALLIVDALMPHVRDLATMKIKLFEALGLNEGKGKLPNGQERQRLVLPQQTKSSWEEQFGNVVKTVN